MANSWKICAEMGISIVPKRTHSNGPLAPRQTRSRRTIREVAEAGEAISYPELVYDVLGLFLASDKNSCQLYGETIQGVSRWVVASRLRTADIPFIRPAFSEIDLGFVRESVMHYRIQNRPPQIGFMVSGLMEPALEQIDFNRRRTA